MIVRKNGREATRLFGGRILVSRRESRLGMLRPTVNDLPLPEALVALIQNGWWVHPGEDRLRQVIPFLVDPVVFLRSPEAMARESKGLLADDPRWGATFHILRGDRRTEPIELPWLDADRSIVIAVCKWPGDDVGIA